MTSEIIDQASALEEMMRDHAIQAHRLNRNAVSAEHCAECGEDIPAPRRAAVPGCQTCASCQEEIELRNKQRGQ
ncbi:TraR/DksA family transcriptional regulator [Citrobacter freundii]|nr:TraR/DksA family transcriptional regulator [Citrobacter freundii]